MAYRRITIPSAQATSDNLPKRQPIEKIIEKSRALTSSIGLFAKPIRLSTASSSVSPSLIVGKNIVIIPEVSVLLRPHSKTQLQAPRALSK